MGRANGHKENKKRKADTVCAPITSKMRTLLTSKCFYFGLILLALLLVKPFGFGQSRKFSEGKYYHTYRLLSNDQDRNIVQVGNASNFEQILDNILIPRVVGSDGHRRVREYIINFMQSLGWTVETDPFTDKTPFGNKNFENVVTKLNPNTPRYLVLACHYDSKYFPENAFVGATDSAVPCAMMLHLAATMASYLQKHRNSDTDVSLMFIFFDGEEAFRQWGPKDSIYGARHLAAKWGASLYPPRNRDGTSELDRIDVLVLLDLLGTKAPTFYNYFQDTSQWYKRLNNAEMRMRSSNMLSDYQKPIYFLDRLVRAGIEDDHVPFHQRGVRVLHLIPYPFPDVWHTIQDDKNALDFPTIENLNKVMRVFVAEYLHLDI